jgi:hypothetical protein
MNGEEQILERRLDSITVLCAPPSAFRGELATSVTSESRSEREKRVDDAVAIFFEAREKAC